MKGNGARRLPLGRRISWKCGRDQRGIAQLAVVGIAVGAILLIGLGGYMVYVVNRAANEQPKVVAAPQPKLEDDDAAKARAARTEDPVAKSVEAVQQAYSTYKAAIDKAAAGGTAADDRPAIGLEAVKSFLESSFYQRTYDKEHSDFRGSQPADKDPFNCELTTPPSYNAVMSSSDSGSVTVNASDSNNPAMLRSVTVNKSTYQIVDVACPSNY